jgi:predicted ester cyclase
MSTEENKTLIRRVYEECNKGQEATMAVLEEHYVPNWVAHGTGAFPDMDRATAKQMMLAFYTAFPDMQWVMEDLIAEGDKVVSRYTFRGTHQGEFMGIAPTGKRVSFTGIEIDRIKDGKFVEAWFDEDHLGLMQQLGVIPQMAQTGA